jgi:hypothetical protein
MPISPEVDSALTLAAYVLSSPSVLGIKIPQFEKYSVKGKF